MQTTVLLLRVFLFYMQTSIQDYYYFFFKQASYVFRQSFLGLIENGK